MAMHNLLVLILIIVSLAAGIKNEVFQAPAEDILHKNTGAAQSALPANDGVSDLTGYMTSVKKQSDDIKTCLEHEALTQTDMNQKSAELYELWDDALNLLWSELKLRLPEKEFAALQDEQLIWIAEKEKALEEIGKEFQGGSIYPLIVNGEGAKITEERVCELYELLKQIPSP